MIISLRNYIVHLPLICDRENENLLLKTYPSC